MRVTRAWIAALVPLALIAAACGDDDDETTDATAAPAATDAGTVANTAAEDTADTSAETTAAGTAATDATEATDTTAAGGAAECGAVDIKIAHIADITGPAKSANEQHIRGMDVALDMLAEQGDVTITIDRRDTAGDVARATATMSEVAADDSIVWQFGPANSGEFFAAIPIAEQLQMPIASVSSGGVRELSDFNEYTFRVSFPENRGSQELLDLIASVPAQRIASLYASDNDFARTSAEYFAKTADEAGLEFTTTQTFSVNDINFSTQAAEIAASDPEAVYLATNVNAGLVIKALRDAGVDVPIVSTNSTMHTPSNVYETSGGNTEGVLFVTPYNPEDARPVVVDFIEAYTTKFPDMTPGVQDALGYDAIMMLAQAACSVEGEITRESLREAFSAIEYDGVTGQAMNYPDGYGDLEREGIYVATIVEPGIAAPVD